MFSHSEAWATEEAHAPTFPVFSPQPWSAVVRNFHTDHGHVLLVVVRCLAKALFACPDIPLHFAAGSHVAARTFLFWARKQQASRASSPNLAWGTEILRKALAAGLLTRCENMWRPPASGSKLLNQFPAALVIVPTAIRL